MPPLGPCSVPGRRACAERGGRRPRRNGHGTVSFTKSVTFDCREPLRVAAFWAEVLGSNVGDELCVE